jgi:S-(hydroxymethyl)glutathione dehydrogenase / alcohol dehydrogenase
VGVPSLDTQVTLPALHVATSHKRIAGCFMGGIDLHRDLPVLFDLFRRGALPVDRLIGATRPLAEVGAALDDLVQAKGLRTIISPTS